jgi:hypothetical protein
MSNIDESDELLAVHFPDPSFVRGWQQGFETKLRQLQELRKCNNFVLTIFWPTKLDIELGYVVFN